MLRSTSRSAGAARASAASTTCCACCGGAWGAGRAAPHSSSRCSRRRRVPLGDVFDRQIRGTDDPELVEELRHRRARAGAPASTRGAGPMARARCGSARRCRATRSPAWFDDSPAQAAGLGPGDEISRSTASGSPGEAELRSLARRCAPATASSSRCSARPADPAAASARCAARDALRDRRPGRRGPAANALSPWLGEPHPVCKVMASVTTTAAAGVTATVNGDECAFPDLGASVCSPPRRAARAAGRLAASDRLAERVVPTRPAPMTCRPRTTGMAGPDQGSPRRARHRRRRRPACRARHERGGGGGDDPHAGLDMTAAAYPHGGVDVTRMGLSAPGPGSPRSIRPPRRRHARRRRQAESRLDPALRCFIVVKAGRGRRHTVGAAAAVDKLTWADRPASRSSTEEQAMSPGPR